MNSVEARALSFRHGDGPLVLRGLDFRVEAGEFVCLLGHSGGGKTTLLRLAAGLERPTSGELLVGGAPVAGPGTDRGMVFQEHSLFPWLTARANVAFGVRQAFRRLSRREAEARAVHFLERAGLAGGLDLYPHQMSGGMRQRAAVARMLAMDARVWLLDEPFSALDPTMRLSLQTLVRKLWAEGEPRKTVISVTHNVDEALRLADRILFLGGGRIAGDLRAATGEDTDSDETRRFALRTELARLYREHAAGRDVA